MKNRTFKILLVSAFAIFVLSSCATKKKYGCPGHISIGQLIGL